MSTTAHQARHGKVATKANGKGNTSKTDHSKLETFFHDEIKDIYWAERNWFRRFRKWPKPRRAKLRNAFTEL